MTPAWIIHVRVASALVVLSVALAIFHGFESASYAMLWAILNTQIATRLEPRRGSS